MVVAGIPVNTFQWLSLSVIIVLVLVKLVQRTLFSSNFSHIPGPKAYPIIGNVLDIGQNTTEFFKFVSQQCAIYKGTWILWLGTSAKVYFHTPDCTQAILSSTDYIDKSTEYGLLSGWLKTGLLTSTGAKWHHRRKLLTPAFHYKILETTVRPIQKVADILVTRLEEQVEQMEFNIFPYMKLAALDAICETTMGYDLGAQHDQNSGYTKAIERVTEISMRRFMMPWLHYDFIFNRTAMGKAYHSSLEVIQGFTLKVIKERRQQLLEEKQSSPPKEEESAEDDIVESINRKRPTAFLDLCLQLPELTDNDVREEVDTFMFAGHDTTAGVISWTLYALGHHPDIQARIVAEAESVGFFSGPVSTSTLAQMDYLERCIKEALRLYPPVPVIARQLYAPLKTPSMTIPAGCSIFIHVFEQHRNPEYFSNPLQFDPDRFLEKMKHPYAYIPFSAGPRNCIGQKVAMISQKIFIANILRRFVVESAVKPEDLKLTQNIVLENQDGVSMRLKRRTPMREC